MKAISAKALSLIGDGSGLRAQIVRALAGMGMFKVAQLALSLVTSILLARTLGVAGYGAYSFALSLVALLSMLLCVGMPPLVVREVAVYERNRHWDLIKGLSRRAHGVVLILTMASATVVVAVSYQFADWTIANSYALLTVGAAAIPLLALTGIRRSLLQGLRKPAQGHFPEMVVRPAVFLSFLLPLIAMGWLTPLAAIAGQVLAIAVGFLVGMLLLRKHRVADYRSVEPVYEDRRWRRALLPFSAIAIVSYLNTEMFTPLVGLLTTNEQVAYFRVALTWALVVSLPLTLVESVIHPHVSRLYAANDVEGVKKLVVQSGVLAMALSAPIVIFFFFLGEQFILLLYGDGYQYSYYPFVAMATGFAVVNLIGPSMLLLYATSFENDAFVISLLSLLVTAFLCWMLIPEYGALGAAFAFAAGKIMRALTFRVWAGVRLRSV